jgi:hypothetical protein
MYPSTSKFKSLRAGILNMYKIALGNTLTYEQIWTLF